MAKVISDSRIAQRFVLVGAGFSKSFVPIAIVQILLSVLEAPITPGNFSSRSSQLDLTSLALVGWQGDGLGKCYTQSLSRT